MNYVYYVTRYGEEQSFTIRGGTYRHNSGTVSCVNCMRTYSACLLYDVVYTVELYDRLSDGWTSGSYLSIYAGNDLIVTLTLLSGSYYTYQFRVLDEPAGFSDYYVIGFIIGFSAVIIISIIVAIVKSCKSKKNVPVANTKVFLVCLNPIPAVIPHVKE